MRVIAGEQRDEDRPDEREDRDRLVRLQRRDDRPAAYERKRDTAPIVVRVLS